MLMTSTVAASTAASNRPALAVGDAEFVRPPALSLLDFDADYLARKLGVHGGQHLDERLDLAALDGSPHGFALMMVRGAFVLPVVGVKRRRRLQQRQRKPIRGGFSTVSPCHASLPRSALTHQDMRVNMTGS